MARSRSSWSILATQSAFRHLHWVVLAGGFTVTVLCGSLLLNVPFGTSLSLSPSAGKTNFAADLLAKAKEQAVALPGIGGETFAPGAISMASEDIVIPNEEHDLARVVLEDGSDRRCLTVTAANGQTLSFRILGVRPLKGGQKADADKVELSVATCGQNGQSVVKVVMEAEKAQQQSSQTAAPARSL